MEIDGYIHTGVMFSYKTPKICLKCHNSNLTYHIQIRQKDQAQNHRNLIPYNYPPYSHHFHSVHHVTLAVPIRLKLDDKKLSSPPPLEILRPASHKTPGIRLAGVRRRDQRVLLLQIPTLPFVNKV